MQLRLRHFVAFAVVCLLAVAVPIIIQRHRRAKLVGSWRGQSPFWRRSVDLAIIHFRPDGTYSEIGAGQHRDEGHYSLGYTFSGSTLTLDPWLNGKSIGQECELDITLTDNMMTLRSLGSAYEYERVPSN